MRRMDSPFIITEMIKHKLEDLLPQFSANGVDKRLLTMAVEDFINWLRIRWRGRVYFGGVEVTNLEVQQLFCQSIEEDPETTRDDLNAWVNIWLSKWRERVKLVFKLEPIYDKERSSLHSLVQRGKKMMSYEEAKNYKEPVLFVLITRNEVVGTEILSDTIIQKEAGRLKSSLKTVEDKVQFTVSLTRSARDICRTEGKLIFINTEGMKYE